MKICVINFSGNVGKTLVAAQLLQPRMNAALLSVESLNADARGDGVAVECVRARQFDTLQQRIGLHKDVIVDVGASNVEEFLRTLARVEGLHEDFDLWIVPSMRGRKQQIDTVNTLRTLRQLGVSPDRIRVVFNGIDSDETVQEVFAALCALGGEFFELSASAVLHYNEVYDRIKGTGESLSSVLADERDLKAEIARSDDEDERIRLVQRLATRRLASSARRNLDQAYEVIVSQRAA
jgi:hypothetical protein